MPERPARAAALIGWAAIQHGDRIGALFFNGVHHELRPLGGQRGVMRLIRQLVSATNPESMLAGSKAAADTSHLNEAMVRAESVGVAQIYADDVSTPTGPVRAPLGFCLNHEHCDPVEVVLRVLP